MKKVKKIILSSTIIIMLASPAFAADEQLSSASKTKAECVCKSDKELNCKTATPNRYNGEAARKRSLYPRFLHSKIKKSTKCKCECHTKK